MVRLIFSCRQNIYNINLSCQIVILLFEELLGNANLILTINCKNMIFTSNYKQWEHFSEKRVNNLITPVGRKIADRQFNYSS